MKDLSAQPNVCFYGICLQHLTFRFLLSLLRWSEVTRLLRNYWFRDSQLTPVGPIAASPWEFRPYLWCGNPEGWLVSDVERQKKSDYRERSQTKLSSQSSQIPLQAIVYTTDKRGSRP